MRWFSFGFSRGKLSQIFREPIWEDNFPRQASRGPPCKPCKLDASLHVVAGVAGNFCTTGCFVKILVCAGVLREVQIYLGFLLGCCPSAFLIDESDRVRHGASPKPRGLGTGLGEESIQSTRSNAGFGRSLALTCWVCSSLKKVGDLRCESPFSLRGSGAWLCYGVRGATRTSASCTSSPAVGCTAGGLQWKWSRVAGASRGTGGLDRSCILCGRCKVAVRRYPSGVLSFSCYQQGHRYGTGP